ncbi:MAG: TolC family protein [Candidatus Eremiobacteraeota bacterium]|mgnify:CR=1 FL=1|nr:TolC family protein [Candidatus Eremiobacteraeota bacterium]
MPAPRPVGLFVSLALLTQNLWAELPAQPINLRQTYQGGQEASLNSQLAEEQIEENKARLDQARAAFQPTVQFTASQQNRSANLATQGLSGSGSVLPIGPFVGPFYSFDSRVQVLYTLVDAQARWRAKSAQAAVEVATARRKIRRQESGTRASSAYLQLIATRHSQQYVADDLKAAQETLRLARDQKRVGVAAGIDVTRAETDVVSATLRQQQADRNVVDANLALARALGQPLTFTYLPDQESVPALDQDYTAETALARALRERVEFLVLDSQEQQLAAEVSAAAASTSPTLGLSADYGFAGNTPAANVFGTHNVGLQLQIPLFDGGLSQARVAEQNSLLQQLRLQRHDQTLQAEQEVRSALTSFDLSQKQIGSALSGIRLAESERTMARDRFAAGLTNSLEVTNAQASLARARDAEAQARYSYSQAVLQLAVAMGTPETLTEQPWNTRRNP